MVTFPTFGRVTFPPSQEGHVSQNCPVPTCLLEVIYVCKFWLRRTRKRNKINLEPEETFFGKRKKIQQIYKPTMKSQTFLEGFTLTCFFVFEKCEVETNETIKG